MINLTPHKIVIHHKQFGIDTVIEPSGIVARVSSVEEVVGNDPVTGVPIISRKFGQVIGLPETPTPCLVSSLVLAAIPEGCTWVFAPDTGPTAIRDENGLVIAVTRLIRA